MHEDLGRERAVKASSDRSFGLVMAGFFAVVALWPVLHPPHIPRWWALGVATAFALVGLAWPERLAVLNRLWTRLGLLLSRVVTPIVLGLVFYVTVTPIGLAMRMLGKDPLRLRPSPDAKSYWIVREPPGPSAPSMTRQF